MTRFRGRLLQPRSPTEVRYSSDAVLTVDGGRIVALGPADGAAVDRDLRPHVLAPGFVDAHVHAPQTRVVGSATGPLLPWLQRTVFPAEAEFADVEHARTVAREFAGRLARAGTSLSLVYGSVHGPAADVLCEELSAHGLRAIVGPVWMDEHCPEALRTEPAVSEAIVRDLVARWHGYDSGRIQIAVIPRFALSCSAQALARAGRLARELDLMVSTHLAETVAEGRLARERFGTQDYLRIYEQADLVHDKAVFAHCIHLTDDEWDRMARAGAIVAHCPDSNDFLGSGGMPPDAVGSRGIPVTLGTDIGAGRSFGVFRTLSYAFDNARRQGKPIELAELWWWATRGAALALGQPTLGALEPGLDADFVVLEVPPTATDATAVMQHVVFDHDAQPVRQLFVRGQPTGSG